jgi:transcriptional regulator with XRE-family HTH domain
MDIPELIRSVLRDLDIDQAELSRRLGVGQPTVSKWLRGSGKPDYESCLRLAKITGRPARMWLEAAELDPELVSADAAPHDPEWASFIASIEADWRELDAVARKYAIQGTRAMFSKFHEGAMAPRSTDAQARRKGHSNVSKRGDSGPDTSLSVWWGSQQRDLALAGA